MTLCAVRRVLKVTRDPESGILGRWQIERHLEELTLTNRCFAILSKPIEVLVFVKVPRLSLIVCFIGFRRPLGALLG